MKRRWWNPRISALSLCAIALITHAVLKPLLTERDIVSMIFAAGPQASRVIVAGAAVFAMARLFSLVAMPAVLAWKASTWLVDRLMRERTHDTH